MRSLGRRLRPFCPQGARRFPSAGLKPLKTKPRVPSLNGRRLSLWNPSEGERRSAPVNRHNRSQVPSGRPILTAEQYDEHHCQGGDEDQEEPPGRVTGLRRSIRISHGFASAFIAAHQRPRCLKCIGSLSRVVSHPLRTLRHLHSGPPERPTLLRMRNRAPPAARTMSGSAGLSPLTAARSLPSAIAYSEHQDGDGEALSRAACLEGHRRETQGQPLCEWPAQGLGEVRI